MGSLAIFLVLTISVLCADAALVRVPQGRMPINPDEGRFFEPSTVELVTVVSTLISGLLQKHFFMKIPTFTQLSTYYDR